MEVKDVGSKPEASMGGDAMTTATLPEMGRSLRPGDCVELVQPLERHGLRQGAQGRIVAKMRYWDLVRVDFGKGRQVPVERAKLRRTA
jgi:hypothetical protein